MPGNRLFHLGQALRTPQGFPSALSAGSARLRKAAKPARPAERVLVFSALASDFRARNFAERDVANLGTDPSVPRRRFCAAWTPGSVPGFAHGARTAAVRSHSLFNPAQPEGALNYGETRGQTLVSGKVRRKLSVSPQRSAGGAKGVEHAFGGGAPGKLCGAERTGGGEPLTKVGIGDQAMHDFGDGGRVARVEFQGGRAGDAVHGLDGGTTGGHAGGEGLQNRQPEALEQARIEERAGARVKIVQLLARNPTREFHAIAKLETVAEGVQLRREKTVHAADDEAILGMPLGEDGEGAQQAIQILVRVEGGDRQQERLGTAVGGEIEESRIDAGEHGPD